MIISQRWHRVPSDIVLEALPLFKWQWADGKTPAGEVAALLVYVALRFMAHHEVVDEEHATTVATGSYNDLARATSLSRRLVADGLKRLVAIGLIQPMGSSQKRRYELLGASTTGWFKLPCQAIVSEGVIQPFTKFRLRSKTELHALKLYLYLAARRDNHTPYSMAGYDVISKATGIPEGDIRKASGFLLTSGLLAGVMREPPLMAGKNTPNQYFLAGHQHLGGWQREARLLPTEATGARGAPYM